MGTFLRHSVHTITKTFTWVD